MGRILHFINTLMIIVTINIIIIFHAKKEQIKVPPPPIYFYFLQCIVTPHNKQVRCLRVLLQQIWSKTKYDIAKHNILTRNSLTHHTVSTIKKTER